MSETNGYIPLDRSQESYLRQMALAAKRRREQMAREAEGPLKAQVCTCEKASFYRDDDEIKCWACGRRPA